MSFKVLSNAQVEQFIEDGYVKLEEAFPVKDALAVQDFLWTKVEERSSARKGKPETWTEPMVHIKEAYTDPIFHACATDRFGDAVEDLVGAGRWPTRHTPASWGWWPVNFALGSERPWTVPTGGWHWDGQHFKHSITARDQGLLMLPHFSEVRPQGGGTVVAPGSHEIVARLLSEYPEGVEHGTALQRCPREHPWLAELIGVAPPAPGDEDRIERFMRNTFVDDFGTKLRVDEITASPGDVILAHPFLYHAAAQNLSGTPRFMCNRTAPLAEPMNLNRADGDYSPVEVSIRRAITPRK